MYNKCFQRVEEKYLLSKERKGELLKQIDKYIIRDEHFRSFMRNIYFDTKNYDLIARSIEKPVFKDKFRARTYDDPTKCDEVFLEMKMKYKGVSHKRRTRISYADYLSYVNDGKCDPNNVIWREIDYYFHFYKLRPMMYIAYDRESYAGLEDGNLRITFDTNLRSRSNKLDLANDRKTTKFFTEPTYIMEIKTISALPLWLVRVLSQLEICPTSFSKYGQIYKATLMN